MISLGPIAARSNPETSKSKSNHSPVFNNDELQFSIFDRYAIKQIPAHLTFNFDINPLVPFSSICFCLHCHSTNTGRNCHRSNSGHKQSKKTSSVFSWHCQSMKSLNLLTPLVRTNRSRGGSPAVNRRSSIVSEDIVSGSGYIVSSRTSFGGDSGCRVVDDDTESS